MQLRPRIRRRLRAVVRLSEARVADVDVVVVEAHRLVEATAGAFDSST